MAEKSKSKPKKKLDIPFGTRIACASGILTDILFLKQSTQSNYGNSNHNIDECH